ncbi:hypothetical protein AeMF1_013635 [Aphanomyces euteiches]|nr:hypothetical protein AeMF1_013635 [Aphanomyces euteiches]KAH9184974.1 hypothetical protein AeNC1_013048 [Aphanomyces euteiches]
MDFVEVRTPRSDIEGASGTEQPSSPCMVLEEPPHHKGLLSAVQGTSRTLWEDLCLRIRDLSSCRPILSSGVSKWPGTWSTRASSYVVTSVRFYAANLPVLQKEFLAGIAVALLQVPETVAFSYVAGVDPLVGLYATAFLGILVGALGGTDGIVAGTAGALAVVMPQLTSSTGALADLSYDERIQHLFMAIIFTGIFQLAFGFFGLTKYMSMIPNTAMIGFLNGLSIVMFWTQFTTFQECRDPHMAFRECLRNEELKWMSMSHPSTWTTIAIVVLTMFIMHFFPKVPYLTAVIPPTLVVAVVGVGIEFGINRPLLHAPSRTIGEITPLSGGGFPSLHWPTLGPSPHWGPVLSTGASLAVVGIFESLLTLQVVCELTKRKVSTAICTQETLAQGLGNMICGFFGCLGGASMIGQSTCNVLNGARGRVSAVIGGFTMLAIVLGASPAVEKVPVACLTGIMFIIVIHTFYWPTFRLLLRLQLVDCLGILLTTALAATINLAVAVAAGIVWHALVHAWQHSHLLSHVVVMEGDVKVYGFQGTFLFSSAAAFRDCFAIADDPDQVVVDFDRCLVVDFSAVAAVRQVAMRYREAGKQLIVRHLNPPSMREFSKDMQWTVVPEWPHLPRSS